MYHSITFYMDDVSDEHIFTGYNTWDDWHLIPTKRPHVGPPELEYKYQNELMYEPIDLTNIGNLKGHYKSRSASWEFAVENGHHNWTELYNEIMETLHGKMGNFVLEDDPEYHYRGRFTVKDLDPQPSYSVITIEALCEPYKYKDRVTMSFPSAYSVRNIIPFNTALNDEVPIIVTVKVKENQNSLSVHGLFTDKSEINGVRDGKSIQIGKVYSGHNYVINGENKTVTDVLRSSGVSSNAMHKVIHMISFPTFANGNDNVLVVTSVPGFSSADKVDVDISYIPRSL